ncbi:MAG: hypothetical protein AAGN15_14650 [Cyanobacteria bacterium J06581_3]
MSFKIRQLDKLDYDDVEPILPDYIDAALDEFVTSKVGQAYVKKHPEGGGWIGTFIEMGYLYGELTLPRMTKGAVQQLMEYTLPRKITLMDRSEAADAIPELVAFWTFLKEDYKLRSAGAIAKYLQSIEDKFADWMFDPARGGMAKSFITQGMAAGHDMTTEEGLKAFQEEYNQGIRAGDRPPLAMPNMRMPSDTAPATVPMTEPPPEVRELLEAMGMDLPEAGSQVNPSEFLEQVLNATKQLGAALGQDVDGDPDIAALEQLLTEADGGVLTEAFNPLQPTSEPLADEYAALLEAQDISESEPGTIVQDFQMLLEAIGPKGLSVSGKRQQIPIKLLEEINQKLASPISIALQRPQQKSYPPIHGLYLLLRATGLGEIIRKGKQSRLQINSALYEDWQQLNPTEQYCTLLEAWMVRAHGDMMGEDRSSVMSVGDECLRIWPIFSQQKKNTYKNYVHQDNIRYSLGYCNAALMSLFGFVKITEGKPTKGKGWRIKSIEILPFGEAMMALITKAYIDNDSYWESYEENELPFDELLEYLQPYFPAWQDVLPGIEVAFSPGRHIFKVSLGKVWRRIAISGEASLTYLADLIRSSVDFDSDHLDCFTYQNALGREVRVVHPYMDSDEPSTDDVVVGSLPLLVGGTMEYLFDFGDCWKFEVQLEAIEPEQAISKVKTKKRGKADRVPLGEVIEAHGEAPEQYPESDW